jgi:hypothetical protein
MSLHFQNLAEFQRELKAYGQVAGIPAQEVIKKQGRLLVIDLAKLTPPMGSEGSGPDDESFADQRRVGLKRVEKDIKKGFKSVLNSKVFNRIKNQKSKQDLQGYLVRGEYVKAKRMLDRLKVHTRLVAAPNLKLHAEIRDNRGRVGRGSFMVLKGAEIAPFIKTKQKLVGLAKSGWKVAAAALGAKLPNWITSQQGTGIYKENFSRSSFNSILLGNTVEFVQQPGQRLAIIERALKVRAQSMRHQAEQMLGRAFSGYKGGKYKG